MEISKEDREAFGVDVLNVTNQKFEFQALIDLRREEVIRAIWNLKDKDKLLINRRDGKISKYTVRFIKKIIDVYQFKDVEEAIKFRCG